MADSSPLFTEAEGRAIERSWSFRKSMALGWLFSPFWDVPFVRVGAAFWMTVLDEGLLAAIKPRWGALTFHYLNDGFKPSLWHTWYLVSRRQDAPLYGLYPNGAPRNRDEAERVRRHASRALTASTSNTSITYTAATTTNVFPVYTVTG